MLTEHRLLLFPSVRTPVDRVSRLRVASGDSPFPPSSPVTERSGTPGRSRQDAAGLLAAVGQPSQAEQLLARVRASTGSEDNSREKRHSSTLL
eukprot:m.21961 g.21961  ORF g.21961 m.21961 type:complete len:93 (+) comp28255_c0_seq2:3285-3563(+)